MRLLFLQTEVLLGGDKWLPKEENPVPRLLLGSLSGCWTRPLQTSWHRNKITHRMCSQILKQEFGYFLKHSDNKWVCFPYFLCLACLSQNPMVNLVQSLGRYSFLS